VHPKVTVGVESSASFTTYEQQALNNNNAYSVGPYVEFRPGPYFTLTVRGGYSINQFANTSTNIQTASQNSWYGSINITHKPRASISYSLDIGREVQSGAQSDLVEDWYVRPNITWKIINGLDFNTAISYERGDQGVGSTGSLPGSPNSKFSWYTGELSLQHPLTSRLTLSLDYRLTVRTSSAPNDGYTQNMIGLQLTYRPK
jgi:hemolysin activation/secretion protein